MTTTETRPSRWQVRERHPRRLTACTVPCTAHHGRVTPKRTVHKPSSHRYHGSKSSHVHLPRRDCPVKFADDQKWRACTCGQMKCGRNEAELDAWWDRHRQGLPEPEAQPERKQGRLRRLWGNVRAEVVGVSAWLHRPGTSAPPGTAADEEDGSVGEPVRLAAEARRGIARAVRSFHRAPTHAATVALAFDVVRCLRPHGHIEVANSTNQFGHRCLDPGFALRRNAKTVSFENRAGERIEIIRGRENGRPGWRVVNPTRDSERGTFFYMVSGGAGVDLFGITGGGNWNAAAWATTSNQAVGTTTPTTADRCILDSHSGNMVVTASSTCLSFDCTVGTNYTGTLSGATQLTVGGSNAAPTGGVLLKFRGTWTHAATLQLGNAGGLGASTATVDLNGVTLGGQLNLATGTLGTTIRFTANFNGAAVSATTNNPGTVDWNGITASFTGNFTYTTATSTSVMTFGAAVMSCAGTVSVTTTGTVNANSMVFTCSIGSGVVTVTPTTLNSGTSEWKLTGNTPTFTGTGKSFYKLTRTGTATKTDAFNIGGDFTVTNTLTIAGNSATNRLLVQSSALGTARNITNSGATMTWSNVDFADIALGTSFNASAITGNSGDCGGNTNITFTNSATQTSTGTASFTWSTHGWTSRVPLPQDDVSIPNAFVAGRTVTADMPRLGQTITCTCTGNPIWSNSVLQANFGSFTFASGMTTSGTNGHNFSGRSSYSVTSAAVTWTMGVGVIAPSGTYTLADTLTDSRSAFAMALSVGTFSDGGQTVNLSSVAGNGVQWNGGTANLSGTWNFACNTGINFWDNHNGSTTINGSTCTVNLTTVSTSTRTFAGGSQSCGSLTYNVANSPGILSITGNNTWAGTWNIGSGRIVQCANGATQTGTAATWLNSVRGVNLGGVYLPGTSTDWVSIPDSAALSFAGDLDIQVRVALDNWSPASNPTPVLAKQLTNTTGASYALSMLNGNLRLRTSANGTTLLSHNSTATVSFANGQAGWIRATMDVDNGSAQRVVKFYTAPDAASPVWTQLGTTVTTAGATSIFDSTATVTLSTLDSGAGDAGNVRAPGIYYQAIVKDGYDGAGSTVLSADFTAKTFGANSFTEANGATVTINGVLAQAGDGRISLVSASAGNAATLLSNTAAKVDLDYIVMQDITASGRTPFYAGAHSVDVSGNTNWSFISPTYGETLLVM